MDTDFHLDTGFLPKLRTETIGEFLRRLRPTETSRSAGNWIYCTNERDENVNDASGRAEPSEEGDHSEPGTEENESDDLSDLEISDDLKSALERGRAILDKLVKDLRSPMSGRTKQSLREEAVQALKQVAIESGETCGKWMLFPTLASVDYTWAKVAKATVEGRLGESAKVCTCKEDAMTQPPLTSPKLICVYTYDFQNVEKVKQILDSLIKLRLTPSSFKLDLFTVLGIDRNSKSIYGISPVLYTPQSIREIAAKTAPTPAGNGRWR